MSTRQGPDTISGVIKEQQRSIDAMSKTGGQGSKYTRSGQSVGSQTFVGPVNDYDQYDFKAQVAYEVTPIWPGETGYPGVHYVATVKNVDEGTIHETHEWRTSDSPWLEITQAEYEALETIDPDILYIIIDGPAYSPWIQLTQAEYDALVSPDPNKLYIIVG